MRRIALALLLCLAACGPSGPDPRFDGAWTGTSSVCDAGTNNCSTEMGTRLTITVEDGALRLSGFCPDRSGSMLVTGEGKTLTWSGDAQCAWPPGPLCSTSILHYTSGSISLTGPNRVHIVAGGSVVGCGYVAPVTTTFDGLT